MQQPKTSIEVLGEEESTKTPMPVDPDQRELIQMRDTLAMELENETDECVRRRLQALLEYARPEASIRKVAARMGYSASSVNNWKKLYLGKNGGVKALRPTKRGPSRFKSENQKNQVAIRIAEMLGDECSEVSLRDIQRVLSEEFEICYRHTSGVHQMLASLGFVRPRPYQIPDWVQKMRG
ncbi:hypothetical protein COB72_01135 [bacterium]|nr:MAG: hypothetical protein COB72_01135 [bacterium]